VRGVPDAVAKLFAGADEVGGLHCEQAVGRVEPVLVPPGVSGFGVQVGEAVEGFGM
jgi:hypothetical protein